VENEIFSAYDLLNDLGRYSLSVDATTIDFEVHALQQLCWCGCADVGAMLVLKCRCCNNCVGFEGDSKTRFFFCFFLLIFFFIVFERCHDNCVQISTSKASKAIVLGLKVRDATRICFVLFGKRRNNVFRYLHVEDLFLCLGFNA
jgi:hypothetical protein